MTQDLLTKARSLIKLSRSISNNTEAEIAELRLALEAVIESLESQAAPSEPVELPAGHCGLGCLHEPHLHRLTPDTPNFWCIGKTTDVPLAEAIRPSSPPAPAGCVHPMQDRWAVNMGHWCEACGSYSMNYGETWHQPRLCDG